MQSLISVVSSSEAPGEAAVQTGTASLKANISLELPKQVKQHKRGELRLFLGSISRRCRELDQALIGRCHFLKLTLGLWGFKTHMRRPIYHQTTATEHTDCNLPKSLSRYVSGPDAAANPTTYPQHVYESSTQTLTSKDEINAQAISYALQLCSLSMHL